MQSLQRASSSLGASSSASPVPSLIRGGRRAPAHLARRVESRVRATVRTVASPHERLQSSLDALDAIKASQVNRYAQDTKSCIISIGLTIHNAPVELREKLAVPEAEWPRAIAELTSFPHIEEAAVLSTCNRMELYVVALSWHRGVREVEEWLSRSSGVPLEQLRPYLFLLRDRDATHHLLRVSGGLDSLVMGEGQILAQVKQVYKVGSGAEGFGRQLTGLFKQAITAGKRVRAETSISTGSVSVSSAAVELAQLKLPTRSYSDAKVMIIGAGKMSTLLVKHLLSKGCTQVTVVNRSMPRSEQLRDDFPDMSFDLKLMPDLLQEAENADVIFAASGSEELLLLKEHVAAMRPAGEGVGGVRRFVDISVPRNVAPDIGELGADRAIVYNVDDLKEVVAGNKEARAQAAAEAEVLLREEQRAFEAWRDSLETVPTIKALRSKAEAIRAAEFDRALQRIGDGALSKKQMKAVEELSKGIVNKLLHGPMTALRCDGTDPDAVGQTLANMEALERMFGLAAEQQQAAMAQAQAQGGAQGAAQGGSGTPMDATQAAAMAKRGQQQREQREREQREQQQEKQAVAA